VVFVTARKDGKVLSVTSQSMTARFLTAPDMANALLVCAYVSQVGRAHSANRVSDSENSTSTCVYVFVVCLMVLSIAKALWRKRW
jgi:hypothetical protein